MNEELKKENQDEDFEKQREEARRKDDEKTERNRRKREKRRAAKSKSKPNKGGGEREMEVDGPEMRKEAVSGSSANDAVNEVEAVEVPGVIIHDED